MSKVRCNNCMEVFDENEIIYNAEEGKEYCPHCHKAGCIMDINDFPVPEEKVHDFILIGDEEIYCTDSDCYQYCRKISVTEYEFTQIQWCDVLSKTENKYTVLYGRIDLTAYTVNEIVDALSGFCSSTEDFMDSYCNLKLEEVLPLIAESIFENETGAMDKSISPVMNLTDCIKFQKYKMAEWSQN